MKNQSTVLNKPSKAFTLWFTGLPCAGKTTLARLVAEELERRGVEIEVLDGDDLRSNICKGLGFSKDDRAENIRRAGYLCRLLNKHRVCAIAALISPYRSVRDEVRASLGEFIEVYVKASLNTCMARDVKGLYRKAIAGEVRNFTGVDDPYEPPSAPELLIDTDCEESAAAGARIVRKLESMELIPKREVHPPDMKSRAFALDR
jgi:adenylylsulfate kinase